MARDKRVEGTLEPTKVGPVCVARIAPSRKEYAGDVMLIYRRY